MYVHAVRESVYYCIGLFPTAVYTHVWENMWEGENSWQGSMGASMNVVFAASSPSPGIDSTSLCSLGSQYNNPIPTRFLSPIDCYKIPPQYNVVQSRLECPRNKTKKISVRNETNQNKICFGCILVCFVKQKTKNFVLFRCFEPV